MVTHSNHDLSESSCQFRIRWRLCLLKGCEKGFYPNHPKQRYCSDKCQTAARRWSLIRAQDSYRESAKGKLRRQTQSRTYRQRKKVLRAQENGSKVAQCGGCEGNHKQNEVGNICARPGCYSRVCPTRRSPLKKYCSPQCCKAVRRVTQRERRWHRHVYDCYKLKLSAA